MRFKYDANDPSMYRCCFCCHVRIGTVILGIFSLLSQLAVFTFFAIMTMRPDVLIQLDGSKAWSQMFASNNNNTTNITVMGYNIFNNYLRPRWTSEDKFIFFLLAVAVFLITLQLIYGTIKGRPGYLMPFFCLQVFDFCLHCLVLVGYFSYLPYVKKWLEQMGCDPVSKWVSDMNSDWFMLSAIIVSVSVLTIKAYFIGVVWACYKYLTNYQASVAARVDCNYRVTPNNPEDTEMLLPPKYEDIADTPPTDPTLPPPPPYTLN